MNLQTLLTEQASNIISAWRTNNENNNRSILLVAQLVTSDARPLMYKHIEFIVRRDGGESRAPGVYSLPLQSRGASASESLHQFWERLGWICVAKLLVGDLLWLCANDPATDAEIGIGRRVDAGYQLGWVQAELLG